MGTARAKSWRKDVGKAVSELGSDGGGRAGCSGGHPGTQRSAPALGSPGSAVQEWPGLCLSVDWGLWRHLQEGVCFPAPKGRSQGHRSGACPSPPGQRGGGRRRLGPALVPFRSPSGLSSSPRAQAGPASHWACVGASQGVTQLLMWPVGSHPAAGCSGILSRYCGLEPLGKLAGMHLPGAGSEPSPVPGQGSAARRALAPSTQQPSGL